MAKISNTGSYPNTTPELTDHVPGTDVGAGNATVTFLLSAIRDLLQANFTQVGIGEISPAVELHISSASPVVRLEDDSGTVSYADIEYLNGQLIFDTDGGGAETNADILFRIAGTEYMRVDGTAGNIGIRENSPQTELHISASSPVIRLEDDAGTVSYGDIEYANGAIVLNADGGAVEADPDIVFQIQGTEYMRVDGTNGYIGIGDNSPARALHISNATARIRLEDTSGAGEYAEIQSNAAGDVILRADEGNTAAGSTIEFYVDAALVGSVDATGNLDIADSLRHLGDVNNRIAFGIDTQVFYTNGSERLKITSSGLELGNNGVAVSNILDQDDMSSNSATSLATQQSIKAYVDSSNAEEKIIDYQEFTFSDTWTKPAAAQSGDKVEVQVVGGGGASHRNADATAAYGGAGGGGIIKIYEDIDDFAATETVTVGAGGVATSGNGGNGNNSEFGTAGNANFIRAEGGNGGGGQGGDVHLKDVYGQSLDWQDLIYRGGTGEGSTSNSNTGSIFGGGGGKHAYSAVDDRVGSWSAYAGDAGNSSGTTGSGADGDYDGFFPGGGGGGVDSTVSGPTRGGHGGAGVVRVKVIRRT